MPRSELHESKKKKNWAVFAAVVGFMMLIWIITMVRIANASEFDVENAFPDQRASHQSFTDKQMENFEPLRKRGGERTTGNDDGAYFDGRVCHMYELYNVKDPERLKSYGCDI